MVLIDQIKWYLKNNTWLLAVGIFFIIWKFFLIYTLFHQGLSDPRFNDAPVYIHHIESINQHGEFTSLSYFLFTFGGYGGFEHLTYRIVLGSIAYLLGISSQAVFILSFYIGTILLLPIAVLFLSQFSHKNQLLLSFSLVFLALFNGAGSYHGFFWVVPSFFALILFLLIFTILLGDFKHWKLWIILLTPLLLFTHFIGLYFTVIPVFYIAILGILNKNLDRALVKRTLFYLLITLFFYIPTAIHLHGSPYGGNAYGFETFGKEIGDGVLKNINKTTSADTASFLPGFAQIKTDYFDWLFPHWLGVVSFVGIIFLLFYYKQTKVLSLYFSGLLFTLGSSLHIFGMRSLLFTWPVTYVLYAYGAWFALIFIQEHISDKRIRQVFLGCATVLVVVFFILNIVYSYAWNSGSQFSIKAYVQDLLNY